jgi:diguanylate cyclase (GGDEF)-like protein
MKRLLTYETQFNQFPTLLEKLQFVKQLNRQAEFEFALTFYLRLKDEFEQLQQHEQVMDCLSGICQSLGNLGRVIEIEHYLSEYKKYCHQYGDRIAKLKLYSFIGYISASIEDFETAVEHYETAITIASALEDFTKSTNLLINLQNVYLELNQLDDAMRCSLQLNQLFKEDREAFSKLSYCAYLLNHMTLLLEVNDLEQFPELMKDLENVEGYYKLKREQMYASFLHGLYYEKLGEIEKAINHLEVAYEYLEITKESPYFKRILKHLIQLFQREQMLNKALYYSNILVEYLENMERKKLQVKTLELSSELKFQDMQELIYFDSLTNIHNRRYLEIQGENWIQYARENKRMLVCAIFDIDDFKLINDQFGHIVGDEVIQHVAHHLRQHLEENMICARFGGDEFVVLARTKRDYKKVFRKLYTAITNSTINLNGTNICVEISMGVSSLKNAGEFNLRGLIQAADKALYASKEKGKNCITFHL